MPCRDVSAESAARCRRRRAVPLAAGMPDGSQDPVVSMVPLDWLWLLLPVAATSGWYAAMRRKRGEKRSSTQTELRNHYFRGVNYLLNEEPDKAIELFIRMLEVDSETVDTHLALGNLYRRRGEVDRAIRIHHNLIEGGALGAEERSEAMLELGQDYLSAGLLDRAESVYLSLAEHEVHGVRALGQLIDIYEQEQDWDKAIAAARRLQDLTRGELGAVMAHYCCEKAEGLNARGKREDAIAALGRALELHRGCVRARLLEGDMRRAGLEHELALEAYLGVESQDPKYLPEVLPNLRKCFEALDRRDELWDYLRHLIDAYGSVAATLELADLIREREGLDSALAFVTGQLEQRVSIRGLHYLIDLELRKQGARAPGYLRLQRALTAALLEDRSLYQCGHCGFRARSLHWRCPSCKQWNTVKPIQELNGGA